MQKRGKLRKKIKVFMTSEEGKMLDADIVKLGIALGIIGGSAVRAEAGWVNQRYDVHDNYVTETSHHSSTNAVHSNYWSGCC